MTFSRWLLGMLVFSSCAQPLYQGARRPRSQVATIETDDTVLEVVDGRSLNTRGKIEILPGAHRVAVSMWHVDETRLGSGPFRSVYYLRESGAVCFKAYPGREYRVRPARGRKVWWPEIIDLTNQTTVRTWDSCQESPNTGNPQSNPDPQGAGAP